MMLRFRNLIVGCAGLATLALAGCSGTVPLTYSPSSVYTATGAVTIGSFVYLPAQKGEVSPKQIGNTAIGDIYLDKNIADYYQNAVFNEFRLIGIKVANPNRELTGTITKLLADDLGFSVDWTLTVNYTVKNKNGEDVLYQGEKTIKQNSSKFAHPMGAFNEIIRKNIEALIRDPSFLKAIGGTLLSTGPRGN